MSMYRCDQCNKEMDIASWSHNTICPKCRKVNHAQIDLNKAKKA